MKETKVGYRYFTLTLNRLHQVVTACWRDSEPMGTCFHERLLKRPKGEDSLLSARRHAQGPGGAHLPREPLFGQTLRRQSQQRKISCPQEEAGGRPEARREGHEAARRRSRRTPLPHPPRALRLRGSHDGPIREPLDHVPRYSQDRPHQEKGGRSATERDESS